MAKAKQPVIEMDFVSSFSEHSKGSESEGAADAATAETSEASREHDGVCLPGIDTLTR